MADMKYAIWSTNRFNDDILQDIVAYFNNLELAQEFVAYQAQKGQSYIITDRNGNPIGYDLNDMNNEEFKKMLEELENDPELKNVRIPDEWDARFRKIIEETVERSRSEELEPGQNYQIERDLKDMPLAELRKLAIDYWYFLFEKGFGNHSREEFRRYEQILEEVKNRGFDSPYDIEELER